MSPINHALAVGLLLAGGAAAAQNSDQDRMRCASGNPAVAITGCTAMIEAGAEPNDFLAVAYHYRGNARLERGEFDDAIGDFAEAIRLNPDLPEVFYDRGRAYLAKKDTRRAIQDFGQAIGLNPDIPEVYDLRGVAYYDGGNPDRAAEDYERAIMLDPMYAPAFVHRGNLYSDKGDYDRGLKDYDEAIRLDGRDAETWHRRGEAYFRKQDYDRAAGDLDQALKLDPDNENAVWRRAVTRFVLARYAEAAQDAERTVQLNPDFQYGILWRYIASGRSGAPKPAVLAYSGKVDISKWPGPILALYIGVLTPRQVSDAANRAGGGKSGTGYACEAAFYIGELRLLQNDSKGAKESLQSVVRTCPHTFDEYHAAVAELGRLP